MTARNSLAGTSSSVKSAHTSHETTSVSIVSDSALLREGIVALLELHDFVRVVDSCTCADDPIQIYQPGHVVLLDGSGHPETALGWIRRCCEADPSVQVLVIELANSADPILACIEAGAKAYTLRGASIGEVIEALKALHCGGAYCSPELTAQLFTRLTLLRSTLDRAPTQPIPLTARELEVLRYLIDDCSNQQIADLLVIQVRTVKHHVHNILAKLNVRHRWDAACLALELGWLGDE